MPAQIRVLDYAANDEHGDFVEALEITKKGRQHYVLHRGITVSSKEFRHEKKEYPSQRALRQAFPGYGVKDWEVTDGVCGYKLPWASLSQALTEWRSKMRPSAA